MKNGDTKPDRPKRGRRRARRKRGKERGKKEKDEENNKEEGRVCVVSMSYKEWQHDVP